MLGHSSVQLTLDTYSHLLPDLQLKERAAARLNKILTAKSPEGSKNPGQNPGQKKGRSGEPPGNRTPNPQIKSLLLCQLS